MPGQGEGRGPRLTLSQTVGALASGGADALIRRGTMAGLVANDHGDDCAVGILCRVGIRAVGAHRVRTPYPASVLARAGALFNNGGESPDPGWA